MHCNRAKSMRETPMKYHQIQCGFTAETQWLITFRMLFTSPIWLLGLLPWSVAAVLLFLGRRPKWNVPFLQLWQLQMPKEAARRKFAIPPAGVVLGLVAALLAIVASAGPGIRG